MDFRNFSIEELVNKVKTKEVSAKEITQAAIDNIERIDGEINAFCATNHEDALIQAEEISGYTDRCERSRRC